MSGNAQIKRKRRANLTALVKPYLDAGLTMDDLITEGLPGGGVRIYVRTKTTEAKPPVNPTKAKSDWSDAPAFE